MAISEKIINRIKSIVNLSDHVDTETAHAAIKNNIYFRGPNVWILAFSIVIASVGLNVNSIPVIIGAMLISPLMGPIFGVGLGLGTNDLELIKDSLRNLLIMIIISLTASTIYFWATPLTLSNPTELIARTNPTIFDVIIALFGGLAGIFEQCRKSKGTVFSGVAIATALMPPLCTAGFGIASGNLHFFLGAIYLFCINCIFITLATYIMVKYMKFKSVEFENAKKGKKVKAIISVVIVLFIIPSILSAFTMIRESNFEKNVSDFIEANKTMDKAYIYNYRVTHHSYRDSEVKIYVSGSALNEGEKKMLKDKALNQYGIKKLEIDETASAAALGEQKAIKDLIESQNKKYQDEKTRLKQEIDELKAEKLDYEKYYNELVSLYPSISEMYLSKGMSIKAAEEAPQQNETAYVSLKTTTALTPAEKQQIARLLSTKMKIKVENIVIENVVSAEVAEPAPATNENENE